MPPQQMPQQPQHMQQPPLWDNQHQQVPQQQNRPLPTLLAAPMVDPVMPPSKIGGLAATMRQAEQQKLSGCGAAPAGGLPDFDRMNYIQQQQELYRQHQQRLEQQTAQYQQQQLQLQ